MRTLTLVFWVVAALLALFLGLRYLASRWNKSPLKWAEALSFGLFATSAVCLFSLGVLNAACSTTLIASRDPGGFGTVQIEEFCTFPDCVVDVAVHEPWRLEKVIAIRRDCIVNFAHVAWSPDSRFAAVYVGNSFCSSIREGYDFATHSVVPFDPLADVMRESIVKDYGLQPQDLANYGGDALRWAHDDRGTYPPGTNAFRARYGRR